MKAHGIAIISLLILGTSAQAALIAYDGFSYSPGQPLTSQPAWSASGTGDSITVGSGNLSVTNLQPSTGNLVTFAGDGADARYAFTPQTTNTFFSCAFRITDSTSLDSNGGYFASFSDNASSLGSVVWLRSHGPSHYDLGGSNNPTSPIQWNTNAGNGFTVGLTMFIVTSYEFVSGPSNDTLNVWLYEDPFLGSATFGQPPLGSAIQVSGGPELSQVSGFTLTQLSTTGTPAMEFDELRIGHSFEEVTPVVPEPSSALLFVSGIAFCLRRRTLSLRS